FLSKISGQDDIVTGTVVSRRSQESLESIIGMFVNTLPLRNYPSAEKSFPEFLQELKKNTLAAFENQDYPLEELVDRMDIIRDTSRNPLIDVGFTLETRELSPTIDIAGLKMHPHQTGSNTSKLDLNFIAIESSAGLKFILEYATKLFKKETIQRFNRHFKTLVSRVLNRP
ncbi:MAG: hypothetical protein GY950_02785, partial [bacterium]|nr:hypothetical protein [bacterium]